ncbi:hypothetical protein DYB38_007712, partial [Aphanomyces astaci]
NESPRHATAAGVNWTVETVGVMAASSKVYDSVFPRTENVATPLDRMSTGGSPAKRFRLLMAAM